MSVYKYKWSQHICSFPSSQLQNCRFLVFQESLNSSINVKDGFPSPIFKLNRTQREGPSQVMSLPYFAQPGKTAPEHEACGISHSMQGEVQQILHRRTCVEGGLQGLWWVHNAARMELASPHFHQPLQLRNTEVTQFCGHHLASL